MSPELVLITFNKIMQSHSYTVIILGTEQKRFAIYTEPQVGKNIQFFLTAEQRIRPLTHDLIHAVWKGLDVKPLHIVIHHREDTVYFARLYLEQVVDGKKTILEIDCRPSDAVTLALMNGIPIFCRKEVLEKAISVED